MKKSFLRFIVFFISISLIWSFIILNGCTNRDPALPSGSSPTSVNEPGAIQSEIKNGSQETNIKNTEKSVSKTMLSEEEMLVETNNMLSDEVEPFIFLAFLSDNITNLNPENANIAFDDLEKLLKIYEMKYTDKMLQGKDHNFQEQLNDYVLSNLDDKTEELTKEQLLAISDFELKNLIFEIFDSGYKLITLEGAWYPIIDYSRFKDFIDYLSDDYAAYISFRALESDKTFAKDAALQITWDELAERVLAVEDFLLKYPESNKYEDMGNSYFSYLMFYFIGMNNTPAFDYETDHFKEEVLTSYKKMISNPEYDGFFTVKLISKYMDVIVENNNLLNENVRKYIRDSYMQVEKEYKIINPFTQS